MFPYMRQASPYCPRELLRKLDIIKNEGDPVFNNDMSLN